jgi:hypothetical protein
MVSRLSALMIQGNEVLCDAVLDRESNKWEGWIFMLRAGEIHTPIVNTSPYYDNKQQAIEAMNNFVDQIRKVDELS